MSCLLRTEEYEISPRRLVKVSFFFLTISWDLGFWVPHVFFCLILLILFFLGNMYFAICSHIRAGSMEGILSVALG